MTLNLDTSSPLRSLARQRELVQAIYNAPSSTQETDWLEWKSQVDIREKRWQAELSRQVLGMANRDPAVAAKWVGGCGLIVVGASPGELVGTAVHDTSEIEAWISRYVGRTPNAPEWAPAYVEVEGKRVLILTVESPQSGQPAWPCRKTYSPDPRSDDMRAIRDGAVFVRHKANTEEANSSDIEMLSRRAAGGRRRLAGISLAMDPTCHAISLDTSAAAREAWAEQERMALRPPTPSPPLRVPVDPAIEASLLAATKALADLGMQKALFARDERTLADYQAEVDAYIAEAKKALQAVVFRKAYERKLGQISISVCNETDDPIHRLQVELVVAVKGVIAVSESADLPEVTLPKRPIMFGRGGHSVFEALGGLGIVNQRILMPRAALGFSRGVKIDHANGVRLTFDAVDLYPQETVRLDKFVLLANRTHAGATLSAEWSARAGDISGVVRGMLEIPVDARAPTIAELLAADDSAKVYDDKEDQEQG